MKVYNILKLLVFVLIGLTLVSLPSFTEGQNLDNAIGGMKLLMGSEGGSSAPTVEENNDISDENGTEIPETESATCGPESLVPIETCELGQGQLCLNTPPLSVADDYVVVRGTVDKRTSLFSHLRAYSQHEYTKEFNEVVLDSMASSDCWQDDWVDTFDGCVDSVGYFGLKIPLSELGPYTIMIDAVSLNGDAVSKTVRTSNVAPVNLSLDDITIDPDPSASDGKIETTKIRLGIDFLHGCTNCDFIGTSTGGVMVTVTNLIHSLDGGTKTIVRQGNISAGGRIDVCVPVLEGKNDLVVEACNAATEGSCPRLEDITFDVISGEARINIISPSGSKLIYSAAENSVIPLKFFIENYSHPGGGCGEGDVIIRWNRNRPVSLCPVSDGSYSARLIPQVGVNVGTVEVLDGDNKFTESFVVGWGKVVNSYVNEEAGWLKDALGVHVGSQYINETVRPLINNFLNSDNLKLFLKDVFSGGRPKDSGDQVDENGGSAEDMIAKIKDEIPFCSSESEGSGVRIQLVGEPVLKWGELERLGFEDSAINFRLNLEGVEAHIKVFRDDDGDGMPDGSFLPLLIAFKGVQFDGKIDMVEGKSGLLFLITSEHTDCDYQSASYCEKKPAVLIPQNMVGGATKGGSFVRCDDNGQQMDGGMEDSCEGLNILNAQTGLLNQKVQDMINDLLYCQGSAVLTHFIRDGLKEINFPFKLRNKNIWISGGLDPTAGKISINQNGIGAQVPARVGSSTAVEHLDERVADTDVGILTNPYCPKTELAGVDSGSIFLALKTDLINALLYQLAFQKLGSGILDWDVDEGFINEMGFDFVAECDAYGAEGEQPEEPYPALCYLRPRVGELLGTDLTTRGYFTRNQPLMVKLRGSREIAPHARIYREEVAFDLPLTGEEDEAGFEYRTVDILELQIPDLEVAFYALKVDEDAGQDIYGNLMPLFDSEGDPVIQSMIEGSKNEVPIIRVKLTMILAMEVSQIETSINDPSKLAIKVRPIPSLTKLIFKKIEGGNATIVRDESLLSAFKGMVDAGLSEYRKLEKVITIEKLSKSISLDFLDQLGPNDLFSKLGLKRLVFGNEGLSLGFEHENERINLVLKPEIEQEL